MKKIFTLSLSTLALAGFIAAASTNTEIGTVSAAADAAATFKAKCAGCHGADGKGVAALGTPDYTDAKWQKSKTNAALTAMINNGKGQMPAYKSSMTPADIKALVAHIRTFAPKAPAKK